MILLSVKIETLFLKSFVIICAFNCLLITFSYLFNRKSDCSKEGQACTDGQVEESKYKCIVLIFLLSPLLFLLDGTALCCQMWPIMSVSSFRMAILASYNTCNFCFIFIQNLEKAIGSNIEKEIASRAAAQELRSLTVVTSPSPNVSQSKKKSKKK